MDKIYDFPLPKLLDNRCKEHFVPALKTAGEVVETIAYELAGEVDGSFTSELILLAAEIDKSANKLLKLVGKLEQARARE